MTPDAKAQIVTLSNEEMFGSPMDLLGHLRRTINAAHQDFSKITDVEAILIAFVSVATKKDISVDFASLELQVPAPASKNTVLGLLEQLMWVTMAGLSQNQLSLDGFLFNAVLCKKANAKYNKPKILLGS